MEIALVTDFQSVSIVSASREDGALATSDKIHCKHTNEQKVTLPSKLNDSKFYPKNFIEKKFHPMISIQPNLTKKSHRLPKPSSRANSSFRGDSSSVLHGVSSMSLFTTDPPPKASQTPFRQQDINDDGDFDDNGARSDQELEHELERFVLTSYNTETKFVAVLAGAATVLATAMGLNPTAIARPAAGGALVPRRPLPQPALHLAARGYLNMIDPFARAAVRALAQYRNEVILIGSSGAAIFGLVYAAVKYQIHLREVVTNNLEWCISAGNDFALSCRAATDEALQFGASVIQGCVNYGLRLKNQTSQMCISEGNGFALLRRAATDKALQFGTSVIQVCANSGLRLKDQTSQMYHLMIDHCALTYRATKDGASRACLATIAAVTSTIGSIDAALKDYGEESQFWLAEKLHMAADYVGESDGHGFARALALSGIAISVVAAAELSTNFAVSFVTEVSNVAVGAWNYFF